MEYAWTREIDEIAREFNVDLHAGLSRQQVASALQKYGKNGKPLPDPPLFSALPRDREARRCCAIAC